MTSNSKWPDFRLASTLWSLVGSQSANSEQNKSTAQNGAPAEGENHRREHEAAFESDTHKPVLHEPEASNYAMDDPEAPPIDGLSDFGSFDPDAPLDHDDSGVPDEDFGALEMFDSNATQAPYSSHISEEPFEETSKAPEAVMFEEPPPSAQPRKSKREKKDRKKKGALRESSSPQQPAEDDSLRKGRRSKQRSALSSELASHSKPDSPTLEEAQLPTPSFAVDTPADSETIIPSTQAKRKRKSSDTGEAKQRKKRKSRDPVHQLDPQETVEGTQDGVEAEAPETVVVDEEIPDSDPQQSPSVARLRRRSQSREAQSREASVVLEASGNEMDVDNSIPSAQVENRLETDAFEIHEANGFDGVGHDSDQADQGIDGLVRGAWDVAANGQQHDRGLEGEVPTGDVDMGDVAEHAQNGQDVFDSVYEVPQSPEHDVNPPSTYARRTRSTRKKVAKPTYFEKSPTPETKPYGLGEMPSPSAMTPKPRKRTKKATRVKRGRVPASQTMNEDEEDGASRRNRMTGYTQGRFTDEELSRIARAVETFRSDNHMEQTQVNAMIHAPGGTTAGEAHAALWALIFDTCPDRHRQKIINITRKKFHNFVARGTWTTEQDAELRDLIDVHGTKWSKIAGIINRHPEDLRDRYRNYIVCGDAQRKDAWDEVEERNLTQYILEAMQAIDELRAMDPSRELLQKPYEELIDWQNISERMERTRSRLQCITKWKSMNIKTHGKDKLASYQPDASISFRLEKARRQIAAMPDEERYRLVLAIHGSAASSESRVPWQRLVDKKFRNNWHRSTQMLLWRRLKHSISGWETKTVRDCAQLLVQHYGAEGSLPEVKDDDFSDSQEVEFIQSIMPSNPGTHRTNHISAEYVANSDVEGDDEQTDAIKEDIEAEAPGFTKDSEPEDTNDAIPAKDPAAVLDENIQPDLPVDLPTDPPEAEPGPESEPEPEPEAGAEAITEAAQEAEPEALAGELPELSELPVKLPLDLPEPAPPKATRTAKRTYGKRRSIRKKDPIKRKPAPSQDPIEDIDEYLTQPPVSQVENNSEIDEEEFRKKKTPSKFRHGPAADVANLSDASESVMDDMEDLPARLP